MAGERVLQLGREADDSSPPAFIGSVGTSHGTAWDGDAVHRLRRALDPGA